jgi:aryl carrier-like protein
MGKKYDYTINIAENTITPTIVAWDTTISSEVEM